MYKSYEGLRTFTQPKTYIMKPKTFLDEEWSVEDSYGLQGEGADSQDTIKVRVSQKSKAKDHEGAGNVYDTECVDITATICSVELNNTTKMNSLLDEASKINIDSIIFSYMKKENVDMNLCIKYILCIVTQLENVLTHRVNYNEMKSSILDSDTNRLDFIPQTILYTMNDEKVSYVYEHTGLLPTLTTHTTTPIIVGSGLIAKAITPGNTACIIHEPDSGAVCSYTGAYDSDESYNDLKWCEYMKVNDEMFSMNQKKVIELENYITKYDATHIGGIGTSLRDSVPCTESEPIYYEKPYVAGARLEKVLRKDMKTMQKISVGSTEYRRVEAEYNQEIVLVTDTDTNKYDTLYLEQYEAHMIDLAKIKEAKDASKDAYAQALEAYKICHAALQYISAYQGEDVELKFAEQRMPTNQETSVQSNETDKDISEGLLKLKTYGKACFANVSIDEFTGMMKDISAENDSEEKDSDEIQPLVLRGRKLSVKDGDKGIYTYEARTNLIDCLPRRSGVPPWQACKKCGMYGNYHDSCLPK